MSLTQHEITKIDEIIEQMHLNASNLYIRYLAFKYFVGQSVDVFTEYYLEFDQYTLFWNYHTTSSFLIQSDLRQFYTAYFIPNLTEPIETQIRNYESKNVYKPVKILTVEEKISKIAKLAETIPEIKEYLSSSAYK